MKFLKSYSIGLILAFLLVIILSSCSEDCKFNSITTDQLPDATIGQEYSAKIYYDLTCSYVSKSVETTAGELPPGIDMDGSGELSGIPTETGTYKFTIKMRICFGTNGFDFTDCHDKTKEITLKVKEK